MTIGWCLVRGHCHKRRLLGEGTRVDIKTEDMFLTQEMGWAKMGIPLLLLEALRSLHTYL